MFIHQRLHISIITDYGTLHYGNVCVFIIRLQLPLLAPQDKVTVHCTLIRFALGASWPVCIAFLPSWP